MRFYIILLFLILSTLTYSNTIFDQDTTDFEIEFESDLSFNNNIYSVNRTGLVFQVMLTRSNKILNNDFIKNLQPVFIEKTVDLNHFTYYVGQFRTLEAAQLAKRELFNLGYNESIIVSYLDGVKIPLYKAKKLIDQEILISKSNYLSLLNYELNYIHKTKDAESLSYTDIDFNLKDKYHLAKMSYNASLKTEDKHKSEEREFYEWWKPRVITYKKNPYWKFSGDLNFQFSQQTLSDWKRGGDDYMSLITDNKFYANYKKGIVKWNSYVKERLVYMKASEKPLKKSSEKFELNSVIGIEAIGSWFYDLKFNLNSQLFPSYIKDTRDKSSDFLSPGKMTVALGMGYDPSSNFSIKIFPVTFTSIFVLLKDRIKYSNSESKDIEDMKLTFGTSSEINFSFNIIEKLNVVGKVLLYSDYVENVKNLDFDGELILTYKISKYFTIRFTNYAIYNENDNINVIKGKKNTSNGFREGFQLKRLFTVGLTYKFKDYSIFED